MGKVILPTRAQVLRRAVLLRRYENDIAARVSDRIASARDEVAGLIQARPITAVSAGRRAARLESVAGETDDVIVGAYRDLWQLSRGELADLAGASSQFAAGIARSLLDEGSTTGAVTFGLPTPTQLRAIIVTNPMDGAPLKDWWGQQSTATTNAVRRQLQIGMARGESAGEMVDRIRGTPIGNGLYDGGVFATSTRSASAIVRTSVNYVNNQAALATYAENADIVSGVEWVATLDERTCEQCADLDGQVWSQDDDRLQTPPAHVNCRCTTVPVIDWKALGGSEPADAPTRQTYPEWFDDQSDETQNAILGPGRADLYRSGSATFSDFVRQDGSRVPLSHLQ